jgi:ribonuclease J
MLVRPSARKELARIGGLAGSALVYSLWEGYLQQEYTAEFMEWIRQQGCRVEQVHTGGHATAETLKKVVDVLKPKCVIPVHTEKAEEFLVISPGVHILLGGDGEISIV